MRISLISLILTHVYLPSILYVEKLPSGQIQVWNFVTAAAITIV